MMDISFEINGKKVSPDSIGNALEREMLEGAKNSIIKKVGNIRCPQHGEAPNIVFKGQNLEGLSFEVSGCCQSLVEAVRSAFK